MIAASAPISEAKATNYHHSKTLMLEAYPNCKCRTIPYLFVSDPTGCPPWEQQDEAIAPIAITKGYIENRDPSSYQLDPI